MFDKEHLEFHSVNLDAGWGTSVGYPAGIEQKILADSLDEAAGRGNRSRLLRLAPGAFTTSPFVHDYWEEIYLLSGDLIVEAGAEAEASVPHTYGGCPPGGYHGPFRSEGCKVLRRRHYSHGTRNRRAS